MRVCLFLFLLTCAPAALRAGYSYDSTSLPYVGGNWWANGTVDYDYSGGIDFYEDAGSFIYQPAVSIETVGGVSGNANDYEVSMTLSIPSSTVVEFLRASPDALRSNGAAAGSFISVEYTAGSGNLSIYQSVGGTLTLLGSVGISGGGGSSKTLRSVVWGTTLWVFLNNQLVYSNAGLPATTGQPGVGGFPSNPAYWATDITGVSIGHHDIVAPVTPNQSTLRSSVLPNSASLAWQGIADDAQGIGLYRYNVSRNGTPLTYVFGTPVFTDSTLSPSTSYTYTISAIDQHGNATPAVNYTITTPPANSVDAKRTGLYPTGSYWGGGGEQVDTLSGNLNFSIPLVKPMGRTGWAVPIGLSYNSQNWRFDGNYNWSSGTDTGYGYGWTMQIGSITPYYAGWTSGVDHYEYTDGSGASYRLDQNTGNVWSSLQGVYIWFDANTNRLHFKDGKFWVMGCTSSAGEQDAGTLYPTILEDVSGNQIIVTYQAAVGLPSAMTNTSSRIVTIEDTRAQYLGSYPAVHYGTYQFSYNTDAIPHLTGITNFIQSAETFPGFTYAENVPLAPPPFNSPSPNPDPNYSGVTTTHLTNIVVPAAGPTSSSYPAAGQYTFTYDSAGAGELSQVTFPYGGHLRWVYANATYAGGRQLREIASRYLSTDASGVSEWNPYQFTHSDSGTISTVHADTTLADASGNGAKKWTFNQNGSTWSPSGAWQIGLSSKFQQMSAATGGANITEDDFTWTETTGSTSTPAIGAQPYITQKTHVLDPGGSNQQSAYSAQTVDAYGNSTEEDIYPYNNISTILQKIQSSYTDTSSYGAYMSSYVLDRLVTTTVTDSVGVHTLVQNLYDNSGSPCGGYTGWFGGPWVRESDTSPPVSLYNRGLLTKTTTPLKSTCMSYDGEGNLSSATGSDGSALSVPTSVSYNYAAPSTLTTESYNYSLSYNAWLGLLSSTGANGEQMSMTYDSYGRPSASTSPYGGTIAYAYPNGTSGQPTVLPTYQIKEVPSGTSGSSTYTLLDGVGHPIQTMMVDLTAGPQSYTSSIYSPCACSPMGKLQASSQPAAVIGSPSPWTLITGGTLAWTSYTYDGIGRTLTVTQPDGVSTTHYAYSGNQTTVTDPNGNTKTFTTDVLGNLITVTEPDPEHSGSWVTTSYTYDWMNHLTTSTMTRDGVTQTRTFAYNDAGQLTSATNPENGTVTYTYGPNGLVASKLDANNQTTGYAYDSSNRLILVNHSPGGTLDPCQSVSYTWGADASNWNYGRLSTITYGTLSQVCPQYPGGMPTSFSENYSYSAAGDVLSKGLTIQRGWPDYDGITPTGGAESVSYSYDSLGRTKGMTYFGYDPFNSSSGPPDTWPPSNVTLSYSYDHLGRISGMTDGTATWVQGVTYDVAGRMTQMQYPQYSSPFNYMTESSTYNVNGQLQSMTWSPAVLGQGAPQGTISYFYTSATHTGNNGEIASVTDGVSGETISYNYDVLKRLLSANSTPTSGGTPAAWTQDYSYDGFGNLTSKGSGTIPVDPHTNQLANLSGTLSNVHYDSNGNLLSVTNASAPSNGLTMTYDGSNRVLSAAVASVGTEYYGYDASGHRIYRRLTSGAEEWTLYGARGEKLGTLGFWEICNDPDDPGDCWWEPYTLSTNIWFGNKLLWSGTGSWSGSTPVYADKNGTNRANGARYYPYGDEITSTSNDRVKFATYTRSSLTGLDYADQRYYASSYGRFNTPDSAAAIPRNPATWNRYAYVGGDPINRKDPRGTCWVSVENDQIEDGTVSDEDALVGYGYTHYDGSCNGSGYQDQDLQVFANDLGHCNDASSCMQFANGTGDNDMSADSSPSSPDPSCVQNAIGAAASAAGLNLSSFSNINVQIVGTPTATGGTYGETELNLSGATSDQVNGLIIQMCGLGFANNGMCSSSNVGPGGTVGEPHDGFDGNFRSPGLTNSVQVNTNAAGGNIQIDVDPYNPASSAWGVVLHSILQWLPNKLTGTDNTYGCD